MAYPDVDLWAHCWHHELLGTRSAAYFQIGDELRQAGYDYDVLDTEAISEKTRVADGSLATPTEQFKALVISEVDAVSRSVADPGHRARRGRRDRDFRWRVAAPFYRGWQR